MAKHILKSPVITVNGSDLSQYISKVELNLQYEDVDVTAFTDNGKRHAGGLENDSFGFTIRHDATYSAVDGVIYPLLGTVVAVTVKPKNAAPGPDNPLYSGNVLVTNWKVGGTVGENPTADVTWPVDGVMTRATA
jgi:hypothetical protein